MTKITLYQKVETQIEYQKLNEKKLQNRYKFVKEVSRYILFCMRKYIPIYYTDEMVQLGLIDVEEIPETEEALRKEYYNIMDNLFGSLIEEQQSLENAYKIAKMIPEPPALLESPKERIEKKKL